MSTARRQLIIVYNADATLRGKLVYAYRKLSASSKSEPACAACDITHGGLSLSEVPGWTKVKREIEVQGWEVIQWHRDEVKADVKDWARTNGVRYPVVLARGQDSGDKDGITLAADSGELASCAGDASRLLDALKAKGIIREPPLASL